MPACQSRGESVRGGSILARRSSPSRRAASGPIPTMPADESCRSCFVCCGAVPSCRCGSRSVTFSAASEASQRAYAAKKAAATRTDIGAVSVQQIMVISRFRERLNQLGGACCGWLCERNGGLVRVTAYAASVISQLLAKIRGCRGWCVDGRRENLELQ